MSVQEKKVGKELNTDYCLDQNEVKKYGAKECIKNQFCLFLDPVSKKYVCRSLITNDFCGD